MAALVLFTASAPHPPASADQHTPRTSTHQVAPTTGPPLDHRVGILELRKWHAERASRAPRPAPGAIAESVAPATPTPKASTAPKPRKPSTAPAKPRPPVTVAAPAAGGNAGTVVAFALAQVGKPYVWASSGPNSYDCSGLVVASYARVGMKVPHQTGGLVGRGWQVSRSQLQPGDLVFPSSGHVGIYVGGGKMVHAPKAGDYVKVSSIWSFWTARRLL